MKIFDERTLHQRVISKLLSSQSEFSDINEELLKSDEKYSSYLRNYLISRYLFKYLHEEPEVAFINMYYWLSLFYKEFSKEKGTDVGIEQQISNLLAEISNNVPGFNWQLLEEIKTKIDHNESPFTESVD